MQLLSVMTMFEVPLCKCCGIPRPQFEGHEIRTQVESLPSPHNCIVTTTPFWSVTLNVAPSLQLDSTASANGSPKHSTTATSDVVPAAAIAGAK